MESSLVVSVRDWPEALSVVVTIIARVPFKHVILVGTNELSAVKFVDTRLRPDVVFELRHFFLHGLHFFLELLHLLSDALSMAFIGSDVYIDVVISRIDIHHVDIILRRCLEFFLQ